MFDVDGIVRPWFDRLAAGMPGLELYDAHTHVGACDPDGFRQTPEELLEGLDAAAARASPNARSSWRSRPATSSS